VLHLSTKRVASVLVRLDSEVNGILRKSTPGGNVMEEFDNMDGSSVVVNASQRF